MNVRSLSRLALCAVGAAVALIPSRALNAQLSKFADPGRAAKLAAAYPEIDRLFTEFATREHIPGAAWGIIVDGRLAHVGVTGYRDLATKALVDSNTVFRIASMTKSFTAMAILKLRDDGKLSLDDPAEKYVPELAGLKYPTTDSPRITIRHLLSHAEGFPEDNPWGDQQLAITDEQMSRLMRQGIPFSTAPGTAYEYSNYGFAILGRIVTRASGMPYRDYVTTHILRPLGMTSTTLEPASVAKNRLAQGYRWEDERWKIEPQLPDGAFGAMGGMLTSPRDLGLWVSTFLAAWPASDGPEVAPIRRASLREMQQVSRPRIPTVRRDAGGTIRLVSGGYGFGLRIWSDCFYAHLVEHGGGLPGFGTLMRWLPEHGVGLIAFGNRTYSGWARPFDDALAAMARTGALQPRVAQPSAALVNARHQVSRLVISWSDALADSIAANNLYLDRAKDRRRAELESFRTQVGPCRAPSEFQVVENALRGSWVVSCERGALRVAITLAPTEPPRVQFLDVRVVPSAGIPPQSGICSIQ
jgi:CubicO group peptidase (beta-lactamase class C family)